MRKIDSPCQWILPNSPIVTPKKTRFIIHSTLSTTWDNTTTPVAVSRWDEIATALSSIDDMGTLRTTCKIAHTSDSAKKPHWMDNVGLNIVKFIFLHFGELPFRE